MKRVDFDPVRSSIPQADRLNAVQEYYFSTRLRQIRAMTEAGIEVINLGIGNPDLPPHPDVIRALANSAQAHQNHGYQSYRGTDALRQAFAGWYDRMFRVKLDPAEEVLPLMGSKEGITHVSLALLNPGDQVLIPDPGYPAYAAAARLAGAEPVPYPLEARHGWLPETEMLDALVSPSTRLMWVNYPHMPTGAVATADALRRLVHWAGQRGLVLVNDNPYGLILNEKPLSLLSIAGSRAPVLELNSLSKSHNMAGWRTGLLAGHAGLIDAVIKVKSNIDSGMFRPVMDAAVVALGLGSDWYNALNKTYRKRRAVAAEIMNALGCTFDAGGAGLFLWGRLPGLQPDDVALCDDILSLAHVFITPGSVFGSRGRSYVRLSLCAPEESLRQALVKIQQFKNQNHNSHV